MKTFATVKMRDGASIYVDVDIDELQTIGKGMTGVSPDYHIFRDSRWGRVLLVNLGDVSMVLVDTAEHTLHSDGG